MFWTTLELPFFLLGLPQIIEIVILLKKTNTPKHYLIKALLLYSYALNSVHSHYCYLLLSTPIQDAYILLVAPSWSCTNYIKTSTSSGLYRSMYAFVCSSPFPHIIHHWHSWWPHAHGTATSLSNSTLFCSCVRHSVYKAINSSLVIFGIRFICCYITV